MFGTHGSYNHELFKLDQAKASEGIRDVSELKNWLPYGISAAIFYCLSNEIVSIITAHVDGLSCIFYLSFGSWILGIAYQVVMSILNYRDKSTNHVWHRNNLIVDGKVVWLHIVMFLLLCCIVFAINCSKFLTMYFAHMSGINVGVITTIWSVQPLFAALIDWIFYK